MRTVLWCILQQILCKLELENQTFAHLQFVCIHVCFYICFFYCLHEVKREIFGSLAALLCSEQYFCAELF